LIVEITPQNVCDINKPNQSFDVIGKIIPAYANGKWSFTEHLYEKPYRKNYPDDDENWMEYIDNPDKIIFFYYHNNECIGQIKLRRNWNKYAFIEDIAVSKNHRNRGVGTSLIEKAVEWAKSKNLLGFMLETQDVNLPACRFYNKLGFQIGAVDTMLYSNFDNFNEKAVFWYMKF
jgi:streptothricin acetyltransferase